MDRTTYPHIVDPLLPADAWAKETFGTCQLGDRRSTDRLVTTASKLVVVPDHSLSRAIRDPAGLKGAYHLLHREETTLPAITAPHRARTLLAAGQSEGPVLLVQDTSEVDYSHHPKTTGLGPIGDGRGRGFLVQSVLAIQPGATAASATVLGLAHVDAFNRVPVPRKQETSAEIRKRPRESDCWMRATVAIGTPPGGVRWVLVGDRGADMYRLFVQAQELGQDVLVRAAYDRRVADAEGLSSGVLRAARALPARGPAREISVPAKGTQKARTAHIRVGWAQMTLRPPAGMDNAPALSIRVIRVWEPDPPEDRTPVEWILLTTVPTISVDDAWERVEWYRHRWIVEEYHQALKTGCRLESSQLRDEASLWALLGMCAPIAIRLLHLRMIARANPDAPATTVFDRQTVAVVAALTNTPVEGMTVARAWLLVARLGGHLGRKHDGQPGWKTIWMGMNYVQTTLNGVRLAAQLHPP